MRPIPDAGPSDFSWARLPAYLGFALASAVRRWPIFLLVSAAMVGLAAAALANSPRTYEAECRLLVRTDPGSPFEPSEMATQMAWVAIRRHDNLQRLIRQTDLVAEQRRSRAPLRRLEEWIRQRVGAPLDDEEALIALLERRLIVWAEGGGVVNIRARWDDPVVAHRLVDAAQRGFIETVYHSDVASLADAIPILERRAAELKKELEGRVASVRRLQSDNAPLPSELVRRPVEAPLPEGAQNLRRLLEENRRAIEDLESARDRTIAQLKTRLGEERTVFSESFPGVVDTRRRIEAFSADSPRLLELRQRQAELSRDLAGRLPAGQATATPAAPSAVPSLPPRDRALESVRMDALLAARRYTGILDDIAVLRLRIDAAGTAFQRRYVVVIPSEVAPAPIWPDARRVMIAAVIDAILLGVFAATAANLRAGRRRAARDAAERVDMEVHAS